MEYALHTNLIPGLAAFTSVAWDHSASSIRLATGSVDGTVVIWTAAPLRSSQAPEDDKTANAGRGPAPVTLDTTSDPSSSPSSPLAFNESPTTFVPHTRF